MQHGSMVGNKWILTSLREFIEDRTGKDEFFLVTSKYRAWREERRNASGWMKKYEPSEPHRN